MDTRPLHTTLNRLIISLLPLALPPRADSPQLYAHGMSDVLPIYATFETSLLHIASSSTASPRMIRLLSDLSMPALRRAHRLQADLSILAQPQAAKTIADAPLLHSFLSQIEVSTSAKPHLLIAYTWLLYLAVFSGGRYLRAQLRVANTKSWRIGASPDDDPDEPLQFWCFEGDLDGEDLKAEFKAQIQEVEKELSPGERKDIVDEAKEIMKRLIAIIEEIAAEVDSSRGCLEKSSTQLLAMRPYLPYNMLKVLGSWSWNFASGLGMGLGAVGRGTPA